MKGEIGMKTRIVTILIAAGMLFIMFWVVTMVGVKADSIIVLVKRIFSSLLKSDDILTEPLFYIILVVISLGLAFLFGYKNDVDCKG